MAALASAEAVRLSLGAAADLPQVLTLLRGCSLLETGASEAIESFWLAHVDKRLVGCAGLEVYGDSGLLRSVAVEASARSAGLGSALVEQVVATARKRGLAQLFLLTTTERRFFEQRGFRVVERASVPPLVAASWEFRVGCPATAITMQRDLVEPAARASSGSVGESAGEQRYS